MVKGKHFPWLLVAHILLKILFYMVSFSVVWKNIKLDFKIIHHKVEQHMPVNSAQILGIEGRGSRKSLRPACAT